MHDTKLYQELNRFLIDADIRIASGHSTREWLGGDYTTVYIRRTRHWIHDRSQLTLDIANIFIEEEFRGNGIFTNMLEWLMAIGYPVYVENVLNTRLKVFLELNNFEKLGSTTHSYFKKC